MIKPGSPIADSDYGEGLIHKMTTIRNTFSSEALGPRTIFAALALVAAIAVGLMLLMPGSPLHAQESSIPYDENGTGPVATFTATDPEGQPVFWSLLGEIPSAVPVVDGDPLIDGDFEDNADFSISADGMLSFNIPPDHEDADDVDDDNVYNIVVVASDDVPGAGTTENPTQMSYKRVVITVTDVDEPGVATLSSRQPQVGVELTATLTDDDATDEQVTAATWEWEKSQDMSSWAAIDGAPATAMYSVGSTALDYYLRVTATYQDAHGNEKTAQAVPVSKVRAEPATTDADAAFPDGSNARNVDENSPAGTDAGKPVAANDTVDDVLTYSLSGVDAGSFEIDSATGQITVGSRTILDEETKSSYSVIVTVTEASGDTETETVTITVNDVNEAPMVTGGVTRISKMEDDADPDAGDTDVLAISMYVASDPEDGATVAWSLEGADAGDLMIESADGALTFKEAPNYEAPADAGTDNVYNVTVVATDAGVDSKNKMTAKRDVVVTVTNVEENGAVTLSTQQPKVGVEIEAEVTDLDGGVKDVTWKWERDDDITVLVDNDDTEETIKGATSAAYTPTTDDADKYLRAIASYTDGKGSHTSMETSVAVVVVRTDNSPMFPTDESGKRSIGEGMTGIVGIPVRATDEDGAQLLTYSLSGTDAGSFTITSDTASISDDDRGGQISVGAGTKLDYEAKSSYMVTVTASDPDGLSSSIDVTINVSNMDEAPVVTGDAKKDYEENGTGIVTTFTATDPEGQPVFWSLLGEIPSAVPVVDGDPLIDGDFEDNADFSISADGVLRFNITPDHEDADDVDDDNVYNIVVVASDDAPGAGTDVNGTQIGYKRVVITVTDKDEPGVVTLSSRQPQVDANLTASHSDPEVDSPAITWKWEKSTSRTSGWAAIDDAPDAATYSVESTVENHYLRVTATYQDANNKERTAQAVSGRGAGCACDYGRRRGVPRRLQREECGRELACGNRCGQAGGGQRHRRRCVDLQPKRDGCGFVRDRPCHWPDHGGV